MRFTRASLYSIILSLAFWIFTASQRFAGMSRTITLTPARQAYDTCVHSVSRSVAVQHQCATLSAPSVDDGLAGLQAGICWRQTRILRTCVHMRPSATTICSGSDHISCADAHRFTTCMGKLQVCQADTEGFQIKTALQRHITSRHAHVAVH